jgi:hypothetical protein
MNVQKIYKALDADEMNSALGIICGELERQGYVVKINDTFVASEEFFDGRHEDLEQEFIPLKMALYRDNVLDQEFTMEFTEYHDFVIRRNQ